MKVERYGSPEAGELPCEADGSRHLGLTTSARVGHGLGAATRCDALVARSRRPTRPPFRVGGKC